MSFLQKAKEKASEVARDAADASAKAAGAVAAKAHDPGTQETVKSGLASAGKTAADASAKAAGASAKAAGAVAAKAQDPETQARVKGGLASAGRGARTMVERIDPGILADVIIKATALQEKANARLRRKGSIYRIGEIQVTASLPPGISFAIERISDRELEAEAGAALHTSSELLAEAPAVEQGADAVPEIVSLDGEEQAAIAFEIAEAEASMDATVDALVAADLPAADVPDSPAAGDADAGSA
ncbi:MAG: hypothetical protein MUE82_12490 [Chloroflexi bacterium]|nr:hypothetical protein [Chloroflexota bacterium]